MRTVVLAVAILVLGTALCITSSAQEPAQVWLHMQLLRFDFAKDGLASVKVVLSPSVSTFDNMPAKCSTQSASALEAVEVIPHLNTDGSMKLTGKVFHSLNGKTVTVPFTRIVPKGEGRIVAGYTDSTLPAIKKAVSKGQIPAVSAKYTAFYWQITPTDGPDNTANMNN